MQLALIWNDGGVRLGRASVTMAASSHQMTPNCFNVNNGANISH